MDELKKEEALIAIKEIRQTIENLSTMLLKTEFILSGTLNSYNKSNTNENYIEDQYDPCVYCEEIVNDDDLNCCEENNEY